MSALTSDADAAIPPIALPDPAPPAKTGPDGKPLPPAGAAPPPDEA
ncbi:hypothetical protein H7I93_02970 [Mycobacterium nebraskense]|nr:hypothetical protein [Mycobacterium nebraskense]MCV7116246.1 hypothetical protein [Mycobacterium nebraskense]